MPRERLVNLQVNARTRQMVRRLAKEDYRSMRAEMEWLAEQELARRYSQPNPLVTVEEALAAEEMGQ